MYSVFFSISANTSFTGLFLALIDKRVAFGAAAAAFAGHIPSVRNRNAIRTTHNSRRNNDFLQHDLLLLFIPL